MEESLAPWDHFPDRSAFDIRVKAEVFMERRSKQKKPSMRLSSLLMDLDAALFCEYEHRRVRSQHQSSISAVNRAREENNLRVDKEASAYLKRIQSKLQSPEEKMMLPFDTQMTSLKMESLKFLPINPGILLSLPAPSSVHMDVDPSPVINQKPNGHARTAVEKSMGPKVEVKMQSGLARKKERMTNYGRRPEMETSGDEVEIVTVSKPSEFKTGMTRLVEDCAREGKPVPAFVSSDTDKKRKREDSRVFQSPLLHDIHNQSDSEEDEMPAAKKKATVSSIVSSVTSKSKANGTTKSSTAEKPKENPEAEQFKGLDPEIVERVMNEILDIQLNVRWTDIAGLEDVKQTLQEMIILPNLHPEMFKGLRSPPRGLLLFGPPGNGKTMIAKAIATEAKLTFFSVSASVLCSKWIGEGEKTMRALFAIARAKAPSFIFIDEVDSILCSRSSEEHESSRRLKNEFLLQFDGATTSSDAAVTIMGATNRPFDLDDAARRRMPKRIYVPLPEKITRFNLVNSLLRGENHAMTAPEVDSVAEQLQGYSCADIQQISQQAAMGPVRDKISKGDMSGPLRPITASDFRSAVAATRPSVAPEECKLYEDFSEKFGTKGL